MSDVTAAANSDGVAMGDDDYVILNGDLSFYAPPPTGSDPAAGVGVPGRCAPWLGTLNPDGRTVFVELDASLRDRYDVITCTVQATGSRLHHKVRRRETLQHVKGVRLPWGRRRIGLVGYPKNLFGLATVQLILPIIG